MPTKQADFTEPTNQGELKMMKSLYRSALLAGALATAAVPASAEEFVRVGGGLAGTLPIFAAKLVELIHENVPDVKANVVSGDIEKSLIQVEAGEMDVMISPTFQTKQVFDGNGSLGMATPKLRHLITLYGANIQPVAKAGGVTTLPELAEGQNRVWTGQKSGFFYQVYAPMMEATGISVDDITKAGGVIETYGYLDEVQGFQDGRLDAGIFAGPTPYGLLMQIEDNPGFQLIEMSDADLKKLEEILPGMGSRVIPAGTYKGQDKDIATPYYVNQLVVSEDMSDDMAYTITKIMYENADSFHGLFAGSEEIDNKDVTAYNKIPLHPGAEKFYKEVGAN